MIRACIVLAACLIALLAFSCSESSSKPKVAPPEAVYTVRGRIVSLPSKDKPASSLQIEHEAIDNFVGMDGKLGMSSMTMPFPLAPGVSVDGLAVGDIVEFTFEVRWKSQPRSQTTRIVKLPPETALHFGKANPTK